MKNRGFTLIELIVVIAILAVIMLIGTVAYSSVQERMKVQSDKATCGEIGKALVVRETDLPEEKGIPYYPTLTAYDQLEEVENYIAKDLKPQSMPEGYFITTALQTETGKKILVGIGKAGQEFSDKPYKNKKEAGWAWSEDTEISKFLENNKDEIEVVGSSVVPIEIGEGNTPEGSTNKYKLSVGINNQITMEIQKEAGKEIKIKAGGNYTTWDVSGILQAGTTYNFEMPENNVEIIGITGK